MHPKVVVVGSINRDLSVQVASLPSRGQTVLGDGFASVSGGKGANQAVAAARFGASVSFVGRLGRDVFGDELLAGLQAHEIRVEHVLRDADSPSGIALILIDEQGDNCITVAPGANAKLSVSDVDAARAVIADADIVLLQLEIADDVAQYAAQIASENNVPVILNPAPAKKLDLEFLKSVTVMTPNASEAEFYSGIRVVDAESARQAANVIRVGGVERVVITMGEAGAYYSDENGLGHLVSAPVVNAVDSTAAGDVFNGVLSVLMAEQQPIEEAILQANAAAAISVTRRGAQNSVPSREEVEEFLARSQAMPT